MNRDLYLHRVIEHTVHDLLVRTGVGWIAVENFADAVDTGSGVVARPEALPNVLCCVNAEAIDYKTQGQKKMPADQQ